MSLFNAQGDSLLLVCLPFSRNYVPFNLEKSGIPYMLYSKFLDEMSEGYR
jgi:hypothetical protein